MNSIFIIDDEKEICESIKMILEYEDYGVDYSTSASEGIDKISNGHYSALLLDINMPAMNGFEVIKKVKDIIPSLAVIIISAHGSVENAIKATRLGAFDFLEKPIDRDKLIISVRNAVDQTNLIIENKEIRQVLSGSETILGTSKAIRNILEYDR